MELEIVIVNENSQLEIKEVEAKKAFEYGGYTFYSHAAYGDEYATAISEKNSGAAVLIQKGSLRYVKDMAMDIVTGAKNLDELLSKALTRKQTIIVTGLFKGAGLIQ